MINHKSNKFIIALAAFICVGSSFCPDADNDTRYSLHFELGILASQYPQGGDQFAYEVAQLLEIAKKQKIDGRISDADFDEFNCFCNSSALQPCDPSSNGANSAAYSSSLRKSAETLQKELKALRQELDSSCQFVDAKAKEYRRAYDVCEYRYEDIIKYQREKQKEIIDLIGQKNLKIKALQQEINASNPNYAIEQEKKAEAEKKKAKSWEMYRQSVEADNKAEAFLRSASKLKEILKQLPSGSLIEYEMNVFEAVVRLKIGKITGTKFDLIRRLLNIIYAQREHESKDLPDASLEELQELLEDVKRNHNELPKTPSEIKLIQSRIYEQEKKAKELKDEAKRLHSLYLELHEQPDIVQESVNRSAEINQSSRDEPDIADISKRQEHPTNVADGALNGNGWALVDEVEPEWEVVYHEDLEQGFK